MKQKSDSPTFRYESLRLQNKQDDMAWMLPYFPVFFEDKYDCWRELEIASSLLSDCLYFALQFPGVMLASSKK